MLQLFLSLQQEMTPESCGGASSCQPTRSVMERHVTMSGSRQIAVIEDCVCTPQPTRCHRVVDNVVYFADTPFETVVDVGACKGPCHSGISSFHLFLAILGDSRGFSGILRDSLRSSGASARPVEYAKLH